MLRLSGIILLVAAIGALFGPRRLRLLFWAIGAIALLYAALRLAGIAPGPVPDRAPGRQLGQMCAHDLVEPVACTPASGREKGQVENQVGGVRASASSRRCCAGRARRS